MNPQDEYRVVFDFADKGFQWWFPALGLIFVLIGSVIFWLGRRNRWPLSRRVFGYVFTGFSCFWTLTAFAFTFSEFLKLQSAYNHRTFAVAEGVVTDFVPMPYEGHKDECFTVNEQRFCYSDYGVSSGFSNSASHGGPIREGLPVRVSYVGNTILRLEVRADSLTSYAERTSLANAAEKDWQTRKERDPSLDRMNLGFMIAALFVTGWWNVQPHRFMRFWLKPPYKNITEKLFRVFFAANLLGAIWGLAETIGRRQRAISDYGKGLAIGAAWILVIWIMVHTVEWIARRMTTRSG
jgi:hypothetical protein